MIGRFTRPVSLDSLGKKTAGGLKYKDFAFPDGYTFRQYKEDGSILIVKAPSSEGGQLLTEDNPDTRQAWQAITDRIRNYKAGKVQDFTRVGLLAIESVLVALQPAPRRKRKRRDVEAPPPMVEEAPSFPWLPVGIAAAVVAALAAFA